MNSFFKTRGFSLVEMAVVLGIISVVMGSAIALFSASLEGRALRVTEERMKIIQKALYEYRLANDRLPCPGDAELAISNTNFGKEGVSNGGTTNSGYYWRTGSCVSSATIDANGNKTANGAALPTANSSNVGAVRGMIPVRALGLSDDFAFDGWGRRIMYTVDRRYTMANGFSNWKLFEKPTTAMTGGSVQFLGTDKVNGGNWIGRFGSDGYILANATDLRPSYVPAGADGFSATVSPGNYHLTQWTIPFYYETIQAFGARQGRGYGSGAFVNMTVNVGTSPRVVTFFLTNFTGASKRSTVYGGVGHASQTTHNTAEIITNYGNGFYMSWLVSGTATFQFVDNAGNVSISIILFDTPDYVTVTDEGGTPNSSRITVQDANGNYRAEKAVYVLWSAGKNGHGAYPRGASTTLINAGSDNDQEEANCDCNASATKTAFNTNFYDGSTDTAFDDVLVFASRFQMRAGGE